MQFAVPPPKSGSLCCTLRTVFLSQLAAPTIKEVAKSEECREESKSGIRFWEPGVFDKMKLNLPRNKNKCTSSNFNRLAASG